MEAEINFFFKQIVALEEEAKKEKSNIMDEQIDKILSCFEGTTMELIPILQQVQSELGFLPELAMSKVSRFLNEPESSVYGVATFYEQFRFAPNGKNVITVCRGTACHVRGAQQLIETVENSLGIKEGETTEDQEFTLETAACIGCCALAPCVLVNEEVEAKLTPKKMDEFLKKGEK